MGARTQLVNHVRGAVKSFGARLPKCPARSFHKRVAAHIPEALSPALGPIWSRSLRLPSASAIRPKAGGDLQGALPGDRTLETGRRGSGRSRRFSFVLTLEDPYRFEKSRSVGAYLGLVPARDQSGDRDPQKAHLQGGRRDAKEAAGRKRSLHPRSFWLRLGSETSWRKDSLPRGQERQETGGGGSGEEACGAACTVYGSARKSTTLSQRASGCQEQEKELRRGPMERTSTEEVKLWQSGGCKVRKAAALGSMRFGSCGGDCASRTWSTLFGGGETDRKIAAPPW